MMMKIILLALFMFVATDAKKGGACGKKALCKGLEELKKRVDDLEQEIHDQKVGPKDYSLHFPEIGTTDYASMEGMPDLEAITTCIWMRSTHQLGGNKLTPLFSYATSNSNNQFLFFMGGGFLRVLCHNEKANVEYQVDEKVNDGQWHHLCSTWESSAGSVNIYEDGERLGGAMGIRKGQKIAAGGLLVLGQEQDNVGGGFDPNQSFAGDLSGANVWNRVLTAEEISELSKSCLAGEGNVFQWSDFRSHTHGNVEVNAPSECQA